MDFNQVKARWVQGYVDIHGRPLKTIEDITGEIFIPLEEIRKSGFHIFREQNFDPILIRNENFIHEFNMHLLGEARRFLEQYKLKQVSSDDILKTIELCKAKLIDGKNTTPPRNIMITRTFTSEPQINQQDKKTDKLWTANDITANRSIRMPNNPEMLSLKMETNQQNSGNTTPPTSRGRQQEQQNGFFSNNETRPKRSASQNRNFNDHQIPRNDYHTNSTSVYKESNSKAVDLCSNASDECFSIYKKIIRENIDITKPLLIIPTFVKNKIFFAYLQENQNTLNDFEQKCQIGFKQLNILNPVIGCTYLVQYEGKWTRGILLKIDTTRYFTHLIDVGSNIFVNDVKEIPAELEKLPSKVQRFSTKQDTGQIKLGTTYVVHVVKQFEDKTCVCESVKLVESEKISKIMTVPKLMTQKPIFMPVVKYFTKITDGDLAIIFGENDGKFYIRTKECHSQLQKNSTEIELFNAGDPLTKFENGQLVVSLLENVAKKGRAVVKKVESDHLILHFIDFYKTERKAMKEIYGANQKIAELPVPLIETPVIHGYKQSGLSSDAQQLLEKCILLKTKVVVRFEDNKFDLILDNKSLSEMLSPKTATPIVDNVPSPNVVPSSPVCKEPEIIMKDKSPIKSSRIWYDDMKLLDKEKVLGTGQFEVLTYKAYDDITIMREEDMTNIFLEKLANIEVTSSLPYTPEEHEVCLGLFEDAWYRCTVCEVSNGEYSVMFLEFGNWETLSAEHLRPLPDSLKDIPILGLNCCLKDMERYKSSKIVENRLKELIKIELHNINVLSYDTDSSIFVIEFPEVTKILEDEGLLKN